MRQSGPQNFKSKLSCEEIFTVHWDLAQTKPASGIHFTAAAFHNWPLFTSSKTLAPVFKIFGAIVLGPGKIRRNK
jgi:hypothetical protein